MILIVQFLAIGRITNEIGTAYDPSNGLCIAGFIVSLCSLLLSLYGITGIVGLVLSAVGRSQAVKEGRKTALGTAGIVIGAISALGTWIMMTYVARSLY